ncbi:hypothetical protein TSUD_153590 [Trifolium subterraneum]|uniref:Uncharacterized protein n=1 Tax=Trifolium subterraneum TaxID=3900 RepID=A0A2Z6N813_TRISU|nr:hypothetical protein TSUD_153590 [Trifolium subterraneum]
MESIKDDIKDGDLYGDWLVVTRKKNRKSRPKNQEGRAGVANLEKPLGKGVTFAQLVDVEKEKEESGTKLHVMGSKFHPGESAELPKVWNKKKNKRARGMGHKGNEPNKHGTEKLGLGIKDKNNPAASSQQQRMVHMNQSGERVDPAMNTQNTTTNMPETMSFCAMRTDGQALSVVDKHLKPPAPNESTVERFNEEFEDAKEDDDAMVAETPQHHQ